MTNPTHTAPAALDRAFTFALIEMAMVILMGDQRAALTIPQRAAFGREARVLLEAGVSRARAAVADLVAMGDDEDDAIRRQTGFARVRADEAHRKGAANAEVRARGELAELDYMAAALAGR